MNFPTLLQVTSLLVVSTVPASLLAQTPANSDGNWPKEIVTDQIHLLLYQPEVDTWKDNRIEARSALRMTQLGDPKEMFGTIVMSARTEVDRETRTVSFEDINIKEVNLPSSGSLQPILLKAVRDSSPDWPKTVSLDRLLADLSINQAQSQAEGIRLKNDPPRVVFSTVPAVLIIIDGEPVYKPVEGTHYSRVMNTLALILFDSSINTFYLDGERWWMSATSLNGPWSVATNPPQEIVDIRDQLKKQEDQEEAGALANPNETPPVVYVSTGPAELVVTTGNPQYAPIAKTKLLYVTNTDNDIFIDSKSQQYYTLLAGRWFTAKSTNGPWEWVSGDRLPRDFSRIPPESPKGHVLAAIPGTEQAKEAVIANQIPQTATVRRSEAKLEVHYDGPPRFVPIQGTSMEYAVNTISEVIHAEGRYYAIQHGIWFVADSPLGPWVVADMIPAVIYTIPPSSPLYHVRYAYVYGATPEYVYVGYTPGYLGAYAYDGTVVFGTGWWYPGTLCGDYWCGWPWTWGFGFQFSYWGGGWFWHPMGHHWWYHNPPFAHRIYSEHWNPQWRGSNRTWIRNNVNIYGHWQGNTLAGRALPGLQHGPAAAPSHGAPHPDVYAGRNGQVYQHNERGWSTPNSSGQWQRVPSNPGLERQRQSRSLGQSRQDEFQRRGQTPGIPRTGTFSGRTSAPPRSTSQPRGGVRR